MEQYFQLDNLIIAHTKINNKNIQTRYIYIYIPRKPIDSIDQRGVLLVIKGGCVSLGVILYGIRFRNVMKHIHNHITSFN